MPPKKTTEKPRKTGAKNNALAIPVNISHELEEIVGKGPMGRTDITKKIWEYIKKHNLQDPQEKRMIRPDEKLKKVIGNSAINQMKLQTHLKPHIKGKA